jgi:hypothetical protein
MLHVRSKDVKQLTLGFNTDMLIDLQAPIQRNNKNQDIHISLSSAEIPISFYSFSNNLSNLNIYVDNAISLVIQEGNYDVYEMIDEINAVNGFPYKITYKENQGKYVLTNTDDTQHTINFSQNSSKGLSKALGYDRSDETVNAGGSTTSDGVINFQTIHNIFLFSDLNIENVIATTENSNNYQPILDKIPIKSPPFSILHYNTYDTAQFTSKVDIDIIRSFRLSLKDQNNRLIQMNDVNYELSILFEVHNKTLPLTIEKDIIIDNQIDNRRNLNFDDIDETEKNITENLPTQQQQIRTLNVNNNIPPLIPTFKKPNIVERTIIKKQFNIKPISILQEEDNDIHDNKSSSNLLDAVLQAKLLNL